MVLLPRRGARAKQLITLFTHYSKYKNMRKGHQSQRILRLKTPQCERSFCPSPTVSRFGYPLQLQR